ncbi:kinetochore protein Spc24 [Tachyglossus aculeatus]|uniref:kinetochore protein Spc24 n=1 Tax=Tachyglossus aculeatus TaxID=9261 RepID=UPI0018F6EE00|nr:kinetochore protein Spc24 [Tachyglossus aculeatus]
MAAFSDLEKVNQELLKFLHANRSGTLLRRLLERQEQLGDRLLETQDDAGRKLKDALALEEGVARKFLDKREEMQCTVSTMEQVEKELQEATEKNASLKAELNMLSNELKELKEMEVDIQRLEEEVGEDTAMIPSTVYMTQLYHRISKIEWDFECESTLIKGIHHGPEIAHPIHIDSMQHSKKFVSDYLWSLIDTQW